MAGFSSNSEFNLSVSFQSHGGELNCSFSSSAKSNSSVRFLQVGVSHQPFIVSLQKILQFGSFTHTPTPTSNYRHTCWSVTLLHGVKCNWKISICTGVNGNRAIITWLGCKPSWKQQRPKLFFAPQLMWPWWPPWGWGVGSVTMAIYSSECDADHFPLKNLSGVGAVGHRHNFQPRVRIFHWFAMATCFSGLFKMGGCVCFLELGFFLPPPPSSEYIADHFQQEWQTPPRGKSPLIHRCTCR